MGGIPGGAGRAFAKVCRAQEVQGIGCGRSKQKAIPLGRLAGLGAVGSNSHWSGLCVPRNLELDGDRACSRSGRPGESFTIWGIATMITSQVAAIVWLSRSFSHEHPVRGLVSGLSIGLSLLMLVLTCLLIWFAWIQARH